VPDLGEELIGLPGVWYGVVMSPLEHAQGRVEAVQVYEGLPDLGLAVLLCADKLGALLDRPGNDVKFSHCNA
jgi:hypothetical protein